MPEQSHQPLRLFVALELPDEVHLALGRIQEDLRRLSPERLRWTRPEGIHLTLKFLGNVPASRTDAISGALDAAVTPFELYLHPAALGAFGGARLRVVWVGVGGDTEGLASLATALEGALEPLGFVRERRPFAAHLTLARVPDEMPPAARRELSERLSRYRLLPQPSMTLREVSLMQSILGPKGPAYHRLASFPANEAAGS